MEPRSGSACQKCHVRVTDAPDGVPRRAVLARRVAELIRVGDHAVVSPGHVWFAGFYYPSNAVTAPAVFSTSAG